MSNLEELRELESSGRYVFHGSGEKIEEFEPRQAHNYRNGEKIPDGEPAVFASDILDYAIFMALINKSNLPQGYTAGVSNKNGILEFSVSKEVSEKITNEFKGFVYVFLKNDFERKENSSEYLCKKKIKPIYSICVSRGDFNKTIKIK
jgi:hypothetical protein